MADGDPRRLESSLSERVFKRIAPVVPRSEGQLRLFASLTIWLSQTVVIFASSFSSALAPDDVGFWRVALGVPALTVILVLALVTPRLSDRGQRRVLIAAVMLGTLVNLPLMALTPAQWAIEFNAVAAVMWAGYFLDRRNTALVTGVAVLGSLTPLVIDYPGASSADESRLLVFVPVLIALAAALHFQKRDLNRALHDVSELAYKDPLTGLANRRGLTRGFDELSAAGDEGRSISLLLIDLDDFKLANSVYGHLGGDHALRTIARQLRRSSRQGHLVARIGGDEFAVLAPDVTGDVCRELALLYRGAVRAATRDLRMPGVKVDASVGTAERTGTEDTLDDLLTRADESMYKEKSTHERGAQPSRPVVDSAAVWLSGHDDDTPGWKPIKPLRRIWRRRPFFARFTVVFAVAAPALVIASTFVPGAPVDDVAPVIVSCLAVSIGGLAIFVAKTRHRGMAHRVSDVLTVAVFVLLLHQYGGASSPVLPVIFLLALYQSWFWGSRSIGWRLAALALVFVSPVLYDPAFDGPGWQIAAASLYGSLITSMVLVVVLAINTTVLLGIRQRSRELALTDPLTGLPNRRAFSEQVERDLAVGNEDPELQTALVMIDLDNFKIVNTRLGHRGGDRLLQEIAGALAVVARTTDCVARVGGDEFAAMLPGAGVDAARRLAERFVSAVAIASEPIARKSGIQVTASAGFALCPLHGTTMDDLMRAADDALMSVKRDGKSGARVSDVVSGL